VVRWRWRVQDKVVGAWFSFVKSGNPGARFKPWTAAQPNTMVFGTVSECKPLRDDELITATRRVEAEAPLKPCRQCV
jgi:hypothetical protein